MIGIEEERILKMQGTFYHAQNISYISHYDEGTFPSILLWNARFIHLNYDNLCLLKKNGVTGLPIIPRKVTQCDACILGNHNKHSFHDPHSKAHRKLELIHLIDVAQCWLLVKMVTNIWWHLLMTTPEYVGFIYWRTNLKLLKHLRTFMHGLKMMHNLILDLFNW